MTGIRGKKALKEVIEQGFIQMANTVNLTAQTALRTKTLLLLSRMSRAKDIDELRELEKELDNLSEGAYTSNYLKSQLEIMEKLQQLDN